MSNDRVRLVQSHASHGVALAADGRYLPVRFPRRIERPLPGDFVDIDEAGSVTAAPERHNCFGRGDRRGRFKPLAANVDRAAIVIAPEPAPSRDLLHRYLAACHIQGIEAVVVVNKHDLPIPSDPPFDELEGLAALGIPVHHTRCRPEPALGGLERALGSGATLLAGQSGVGKSSLLNALIPDLAARTGALSRVTGKGTHTTTSATLYPFGDEAFVIDTPGVWEFGLWRMDAKQLERGFPEFAPHAARCRFRDCRHRSEPGCGVIAAVEAGTLPAFRHQAWLRLLAEQERFR